MRLPLFSPPRSRPPWAPSPWVPPECPQRSLALRCRWSADCAPFSTRSGSPSPPAPSLHAAGVRVADRLQRPLNRRRVSFCGVFPSRPQDRRRCGFLPNSAPGRRWARLPGALNLGSRNSAALPPRSSGHASPERTAYKAHTCPCLCHTPGQNGFLRHSVGRRDASPGPDYIIPHSQLAQLLQICRPVSRLSPAGETLGGIRGSRRQRT